MTLRRLLLAALLLGAGDAAAQERQAIAPGQALRLHPGPGADRPVASATYLLDLAAGDWLAVTAPAALVGGAATEPPLALEGPAGPAGRDAGRLVVRIAASGPHRLTVSDVHALSIARYPAGHPVVDPGLTSAQVSIDPAPIAATVAMATEPMDLPYNDAPPPSGWPARLAIDVGGRMTIHVYRTDGLRQLDLWARSPAPEVARLLAGSFAIEAHPDLPLFPEPNGSVTFAARAERIGTGCLRHIRWLARVTQEDTWPFDNLSYVAAGLTRDGRFFVTAQAEATPARMRGQPAEVRDGRSDAYEAALRRQLAGDPAALTPRLAALDSVLTSLVLPCGGP